MINKKIKRICCGALSAAMLTAMPMRAFAAETKILFYDDFENDEVGSAPSNVYKYQEGTVYSQVPKAQITTDYATVMQDTETTNRTKYLNFKPTSDDYKFIQMNLGEEGSKYDKGTVVFEYDGWINVDGNGYNNSKYFYLGSRIANDDKRDKIQIFNHMSTDGRFTLTKEQQQYNALYFVSVSNKNNEPKKDYILSTGESLIHGLDGKTLLRRDYSTWHKYKLEVNLENGECKFWIDGQESETWINTEAKHRIGYGDWGKQYLDSLVLRSDYSAGNLKEKMTPWKLDNIKIYIPAPDPEKITINTYDGKTEEYDLSAGTNTLENPVSTILDNMTVNFGSKVSDGVTASLKNNTTGTDEPVTLKIADDGRSGKISVDKMFIDANNSYTLTLDGTDMFGNSFTTPTIINFTSASEGGLAILSTEISPSDISGLKSGDTVTAAVKYVLTDVMKKKDDVILAITGKKSNKLLYFGQTVENFDKLGVNTVTASFTVDDNIPDTLSAFVWNADLRSPAASFVRIPTE